MAKPSATQLLVGNKINIKQYVLLKYLRSTKKPFSNRTLSLHTGIPINVVTPRMFELRQMLLVQKAGLEFDANTNRTVKIWVAS